MSVRVLIAASLTLGVVNVEAAPIFGQPYLRTVESLGVNGCGSSSVTRRLPRHLPTPSWARQAPSNNLTADSACSGEQSIDDTGSGAQSSSDQSGSTGPQGSAGEHGSGAGVHGGGSGELGSGAGDNGGGVGENGGGAGEPGGGAGEHHGSIGGEQSGLLPLDIDYDSTPDGQAEDFLGDVEIAVDRDVVSVPEPGTLALFGIGLLGGLFVRRRRR